MDHLDLTSVARREAQRQTGSTIEQLRARRFAIDAEIDSWLTVYAESLVDEAQRRLIARSVGPLVSAAPLTSEEAARALRVTPQHIGRLVKRGELTAVQGVGRKLLIPHHEIEARVNGGTR